MRARPYHPTSVLHLTNAVMAECEQTLQAGLTSGRKKPEDAKQVTEHGIT